MRHVPRWLVFTAVVVVLALGSLASLSISLARQSFPEHTGRVDLVGLSSPVEVLRDAYGVPNIYADNAEDLFEAQGYVHAQDRFFEMDFRRHLAAGRLSELFGASQLETDSYVRTLGWRRVAGQELALQSSSTRRYLDAYAAGVNAYLSGRSAGELSLEYSLLGFQGLDYTPEKWTAVDSLSWLKVMAWELGSDFDQESDRAVVTATVGTARAASLYPERPLDGFDPIVGQGTVVGKVFDPNARRVAARPITAGLSQSQLREAAPVLSAAGRARTAIPDVLGADALGGETGSNSWAVSGSRTASGRAILANDPHLATSIPSTFAQVGLHCRTVTPQCPFDVSGFSMAAMPGVVIGKNARIAWGLTTSYVDVQDLYLEDVRDDLVRVGADYQPLDVRTEQIAVRGEDVARELRIRTSKHGPLLSDVDAQLERVGTGRATPGAQPYAVALSWSALTPGRTMDALLAVDQAQDFTQFQAAAALMSAPSQNLIYADVDGNIGYQLPGAIPVRGRGDGLGPAPGWDPAYDWKGTIPRPQLPHLYNPSSGFIVAANQPVIGRQYPYRLGTETSYGWRSQQIADRLRDATGLTMDQAEDIFRDDTIGVAVEVVPALLKVKVSDPWIAEGQRTLVGWDYSSAAESAPAAYFNVVFHNILELTFRDELPPDQWPAAGDRWYAVVATLVDQPRNAWWDNVSTTDRIETRDDILLAAMISARKELTSLMARDTDEWQWGKLHYVRLRSQTLGSSGIRPVESLFNRGHYPVSGGPAVVNAMAYDDLSGYQVTSGPTMRMLVDLGDPDASRWVNQSGVSGHAFHPNYDDQTDLWATGKMWVFVSSRGAVQARSTSRMELVPSG